MEKSLTWQVPKVRLLKLEGWKGQGAACIATGTLASVSCISTGQGALLRCNDGSVALALCGPGTTGDAAASACPEGFAALNECSPGTGVGV